MLRLGYASCVDAVRSDAYGRRADAKRLVAIARRAADGCLAGDPLLRRTRAGAVSPRPEPQPRRGRADAVGAEPAAELSVRPTTTGELAVLDSTGGCAKQPAGPVPAARSAARDCAGGVLRGGADHHRRRAPGGIRGVLSARNLRHGLARAC